MATLTLTDDIPNGTELIAALTQGELESYLLAGNTGFFTYDLDQDMEVDESDLKLDVTGSGMADQPFPQGTITGGTFTNLDTGLLWATLSGLPDIDVTQLIIMAADPTTTLDDYGNYFFGGDDVMEGGAASDILAGYAGKDSLAGGTGRDLLLGGRGGDDINGGLGRDRLAGNSGGDAFVFDAAAGRANADRIADFGKGADTIVLDTAVFVRIGATLDGTEFVTGASASAASHRIIYNDTTGEIFFDRDGDGARAQKLFTIVDAGTSLSAADFDMLV